MSPSSSFDQKLNQLLTSLERLNPASAALLVVGLVVVAILIWLATGIYQVRPGEHAVTLRFGELCDRPIGPCGEGLGTGLDTVPGVKWWWPGPIGRTEVELVDQIRRLEVGFRSGEDGGEAAPWEALMISGDLSIVDVRMVVQYRIRDLTRFLLRVKDPGDPQRGVAAGHADGLTLRYASEAALRLEVGQRSIGQLLDDDRVDLQVETARRLQEVLDSYDSGVRIEGVELLRVVPPEPVREAFDDLPRASQEKEALLRQARGREEEIIAEARDDAESMIEAAQAARPARLVQAQAEADRFVSLLRQYEQETDPARRELHLEVMEEQLPGIARFIDSSGTAP